MRCDSMSGWAFMTVLLVGDFRALSLSVRAVSRIRADAEPCSENPKANGPVRAAYTSLPEQPVGISCRKREDAHGGIVVGVAARAITCGFPVVAGRRSSDAEPVCAGQAHGELRHTPDDGGFR